MYKLSHCTWIEVTHIRCLMVLEGSVKVLWDVSQKKRSLIFSFDVVIILRMLIDNIFRSAWEQLHFQSNLIAGKRVRGGTINFEFLGVSFELKQKKCKQVLPLKLEFKGYTRQKKACFIEFFYFQEVQKSSGLFANACFCSAFNNIPIFKFIYTNG